MYAYMAYFGKINPSPAGLMSSALVMLLGLLLGLLAGVVGKKTFTAYMLLGWLVMNLLIISNWWHFQYFRAYYNYDVFRFGSDGLEVVRSFSAFEYTREALQLLLLSALFSWTAVRWYRPAHYRTTGVYGLKTICLVAGLICFNAIASVGQQLKQKNAYVLLPEYFHPVHAFFLSLDSKVFNDDFVESWNAFKGLNTPVSDQHRFDSISASIGQAPRYNVISIVLESVRASQVGVYGSVDDLTPNLDRIARENSYSKNFYANSNLTIKSETSIFCGVFDHGAKISIAEYREEKLLDCLPEVLANNGYKTFYFHGNSGRFYNRENYMPLLGFQHNYFHKDQPDAGKDGKTYVGWGVSDEDMYELMLASLSQSGEKPFYANLMTLTSHYPFKAKLPIDDVPFKPMQDKRILSSTAVYNNYRNAVAYADYALGKFWRAFEKSPYYKNTIVLITADHGIWNFPEDVADERVKNELFFRMPLVIYHPDVEQPTVIEAPASHIDIMPTLLDLLSVPRVHLPLVGKNIFSEVQRAWAVYVKGSELFLRDGNSVCYRQNTSCSGVQQTCFSSLDLGDAGVSAVCSELNGDVLQGGRFAMPTETADHWYADSYEMISYENHRIFVEPKKLLMSQPKHLQNIEL
ncbi:MAG: phosphoglycerol transferase MdoB-like AlkP superfamily enzyme [Porticoccus sp.]|jgi:phosphoglycerol transferase MdoB-like AlkP superfamily enzyme|tara:strand:- start:491 stop:2392 length:1902 start_codon:yes stop_codon:yes gene_type:complete